MTEIKSHCLSVSVPLPSPKTLQKASVDVISNDVCRNIYSTGITSNHMCADSSTGKGICSVSLTEENTLHKLIINIEILMKGVNVINHSKG